MPAVGLSCSMWDLCIMWDLSLQHTNSLILVTVKDKSLSCLQLFVTPWTVAHQAPPSMEFSRQEYWSGLPFPSPGIFPTQGSNPGLLHCRQMLYHLSQLWLVAQFRSCGMWAQWLWCMGLVTLRHVGSSQTRDWTHVPALEGEFLTTSPPGKSVFWSYNADSCACILRWYICFLGLQYKLQHSEWLKAARHSLTVSLARSSKSRSRQSCAASEGPARPSLVSSFGCLLAFLGFLGWWPVPLICLRPHFTFFCMYVCVAVSLCLALVCVLSLDLGPTQIIQDDLLISRSLT